MKRFGNFVKFEFLKDALTLLRCSVLGAVDKRRRERREGVQLNDKSEGRRQSIGTEISIEK